MVVRGAIVEFPLLQLTSQPGAEHAISVEEEQESPSQCRVESTAFPVPCNIGGGARPTVQTRVYFIYIPFRESRLHAPFHFLITQLTY
jgi:hypothetical protein